LNEPRYAALIVAPPTNKSRSISVPTIAVQIVTLLAQTSEQQAAPTPSTTEMKGMMGKGQMMSNWKDQDAELDKLVTEMNSAPADKKLDAVAALLTKLVEQREAMHQQMEKMMSADDNQAMEMCRKMMGTEMKCGH
jgi:hypothetical protein